MQVEYAFIAEAADAANGLFYVVRGGTDIWHVPPQAEFPLTVGPMSFVVRLMADPSETGTSFPVHFTVVDPDGRSIGVQGDAEIAFQPHPIDRTRSGGALLHFKLALPVPSAGAYFFELHGQGNRLCQVPFWVLTGTEV